MTEGECATAVLEWVREVLPPQGSGDDPGIESGYDYAVGAKVGPLPDAVVFVERKRVVRSDDVEPFSHLQQVWVRMFDIRASIMVEVRREPGDTPEEIEARAAAAHAMLCGFGAELEVSAFADGTLGGRVDTTLPQTVFDYSQPFVEYEDGTRGRLLAIEMTVCELIEGQPG